MILRLPFAWPNPVISSNFSDIFAKLNIPRAFKQYYLQLLPSYRPTSSQPWSVFICPVRSSEGRLLTPILSRYDDPCAGDRDSYVRCRQLQSRVITSGIIITYVVIELSFRNFIMTGLSAARGVPDASLRRASIDWL